MPARPARTKAQSHRAPALVQQRAPSWPQRLEQEAPALELELELELALALELELEPVARQARFSLQRLRRGSRPVRSRCREELAMR